MMQCADCGPVAVSHAAERWSTEFDWVLDRVGRPLEIIWKKLRPAVNALRPGRLAPSFLGLCERLGLGQIITRPDAKNNLRAKVLWEEAERRGIEMREFRLFGLPRELFFATYQGDTRFFDGLPRPRGAHQAAQNWMDDKGVILSRFQKAGIPVPRGGSARTPAEAAALFRDIDGPVIVKPAIGSRSRHTYMHITDRAALGRAFLKAQELSSRVVVEEELPGFVFRVTLIGGRIVGIMRREPPHVMGDGKRTISALIESENKNPLRDGPIFHKLDASAETEAFLKEQGLSLESIPEKGAMVFLHAKVSRSFGASTTEIENIHPDNEKLFLKIGEVLDDPLVGVDFMIEDMSRSWRDSRCGVIECNSLPFIDLHHYPYAGPARNAAGAVWDLIFRHDIRKAIEKTLPMSRLPEPESFWERCVYTFWWLWAPVHPFFQNLLIKIKILRHSGRQDFLLGKLSPGTDLQKFLVYLGTRGFANHFIAWWDDGEIVSLRRLEPNARFQYHLRIFADGEVRGHYEYTPEFHPVWHVKEVDMVSRREEFLDDLGSWVVPSSTS